MNSTRPSAMLAMDDYARRELFDESRWLRLNQSVDLVAESNVTSFDSRDTQAALARVEILVTGWGAPRLTDEVLDAAPELRAVIHAAGSIKGHVTDACWERALLVTSAAEANSIPVAEFAVSAILLAGKRAFEHSKLYAANGQKVPVPKGRRSNFGRIVGLVGFSRVGRRVAESLAPSENTVLVADPYANASDVERAGAQLTTLDDLFVRSEIVSLHAPATPETYEMVDSRRLSLLADWSTIINTARGSLIDMRALEIECVSGRLSAILDVTDPEPLPSTSPLWKLPNVWLTPHIAGAADTELLRLADLALEEIQRYVAGDPPLFPVTADYIDRTA
jgi:phosphoglycerate dehydrogenase-like enzyme